MTGDPRRASGPEVQAGDPFFRRMRAYLAERFPLAGYSVLIFSFCSSSQFLAHALTMPDRPMRYDISTITACVTLIGIFLHLRIFDDHKDYADDCRYWPDRVLQRGIVSLRDLKLLAAGALAVELTLAWLSGIPVVVAVLTAIGFTLLMLREFFLGGWLRSKFLLSAGLHLLLMPILALVVFSFSVSQHFWYADRWFWLYSLAGFLTALNWEISRKIQVPAAEREGVDTYSRVFGAFGAGWLVLLVRAIDTGLLMLVARHLGLPTWLDAALAGLFLLTGIGFLHFRLSPSPATAQRMATWAGTYIILFDLLLALALGVQRGLEFGLWPRN